MKSVRAWVVGGAVTALAMSACGGGEDAGTSSNGAVETKNVVAVIASTDAGSLAPFIIGKGKKYFADLGVDVQAAVVDDTSAALAGGSAQVAIIEPGRLVEAVKSGADMIAFSGYRCREQYAIAIQSQYKSAADLKGANVNLDGSPGDPMVDFRLSLLKDAGWDLSSSGAKFVTVPGRSAAWLQSFKAKKIAVTPFYRSQTAQYQDMGATIPVNKFIEWPNEVMVTTPKFLKDNPKTVAAFLEGMIKSTEFYLDPSSKDEFLAMAKAQDFGTERVEADYNSGPILFCDNLYLEQESFEYLLKTQGVNDAPPYGDLADTAVLEQVQGKLGLDNEPPATSPDPYK